MSVSKPAATIPVSREVLDDALADGLRTYTDTFLDEIRNLDRPRFGPPLPRTVWVIDPPPADPQARYYWDALAAIAADGGYVDEWDEPDRLTACRAIGHTETRPGPPRRSYLRSERLNP